MSEAVAGMVLKVKVVRVKRALFRLRLSFWLLRFAAWVGGYGIEIKEHAE
jgi:hypothetical protein